MPLEVLKMSFFILIYSDAEMDPTIGLNSETLSVIEIGSFSLLIKALSSSSSSEAFLSSLKNGKLMIFKSLTHCFRPFLCF